MAREPSSLTRTTVTGVLWITAGRAVKTPVNLLTVAVLARLLEPQDFGIVAIGFIVSGLATLLIDGSFGMVLVQRRKITPPVVGASLVLSGSLGALAGVVIVAASPLVERFFDFPDLADVLFVLAWILPVSAAAAIWTALLQRGSHFGILTLNSAVAQLVYGAVAVGMAFAGLGMWSLVWAQVVGTCTEALLGFIASHKRYEVAFERGAVREVWRSGGMFTLSKMFNWAAGTVDRLVVGRLLGATALGFYSRATTLLATANQLVGTGLFRVLFSTFSRMQHDRERMQKAFDRTLSTTIIGSCLLAAFMILFADLVVITLLGERWMTTVPLIQALFAAFVSRSGYVVAEAVPLALGLGRASALRQAAQFILVISGAAIGSIFGLVGAAIGVAVAYWVFYLLCLILVRRLLGVSAARLFYIHLKGILIAASPVLAGAGARWLVQAEGELILMLIPPSAFGAAAAMALILAPRSLLSDDLARIRTQLFDRSVRLLRVVKSKSRL